jgi:lycopene beta-cyclase
MQGNSYEYIIAGGGMAGLSLAFYLNESSLKDKKILIIDRDKKDENDHTWCFWENENSVFEEIVFQRWSKFWFHGTRDFSELLSFGDYQYKMIRAIDFYEFVIEKLIRNSNISFVRADITGIENDVVKTSDGEFTAREFVFDSFSRKEYNEPEYHNLWQHFLGWTIETAENIFDPDKMTLFDFRVEQKGECRFIYILPIAKNKALIEFTVFSDNLIEMEEYEENLKKYISGHLPAENYEIKETEYGIIPMSDEPHQQNPASNVVRIGTSAGYVKPSTGYSFKRTQTRLQSLVNNLENLSLSTQHPVPGTKPWKAYLDSVLLNVMQTKKHPVSDVFTCLFKFNEAPQVLKFLDEDTSLREDLKIMRTVPLLKFSKAAVQTVFKKIKN